MEDLIIFGATGLAGLARYYAEHHLGIEVRGFAVDSQYKKADEFESLPLLAWPDVLEQFPVEEVSVFVAVGYNNMRAREAAYMSVKQAGYRMTNIICPSSFVADGVMLGDNNILMPGVVVEPGSTLGSNNVIWSNATICHDCAIGDHNFIAANATLGGRVALGNRNFVGFSSVVLQQRRIGSDTLIGAQTLVNRDTEDLSLYCGSPAKRVRALDPAIGVSVIDD